MKKELKIAIVEDNGVARLNLRNHLVDMGFSEIGSYSHGRELRQSMRGKMFDLILMDYHLGMNKNGVEVIQELQKDGVLKHTTSVVFITSDRLPMIVGQIVDVHPDGVILKPYTIRNLEKNLKSIMALNRYVKPVLKLMDTQEYAEALTKLQELIEADGMPRAQSSLKRLEARLLIMTQQFDTAKGIYENILQSSRHVIWARWGMIQCTYLAGKTEESQSMLSDMLGNHLTNDKACEWLARISITDEEYDDALGYMDKINETNLSLPASRLKAFLFQIQDQMEDALSLLERKRESNRMIRERYAELSLDLARCHLAQAEAREMKDRKEPLATARSLIGNAGRKKIGPEIQLKCDYMSAIVHVLEGEMDKAKELLNKEGMDKLHNADAASITDAVKAWNGVGDILKASEILHEFGDKLVKSNDDTESAMAELLVKQTEESIGEKRPRALKFNKEGLQFYDKGEFFTATDYFYQAYILFPDEVAFSLNLLHCMVEADIAKHKTVQVLPLLHTLQSQELSKGNAARLREITAKVEKNKNNFVVLNTPIPEATFDVGNVN